jgi:hypothetical protein
MYESNTLAIDWGNGKGPKSQKTNWMSAAKEHRTDSHNAIPYYQIQTPVVVAKLVIVSVELSRFSIVKYASLNPATSTSGGDTMV